MRRLPQLEDWFGICELRADVEKALRQRCPNSYELDDLVQETLLKAAHCRVSLSDPECLRAWVLRIAWNVYRDHVRREQRLKRSWVSSEEMEEIDATRDHQATHEEGRRMQHQGREFEVEETLEDLRRLIGELQGDEQTLYAAYYAQGIGCASTARRLGASPKSVKMRLYRLRRKLLRDLRRRRALRSAPLEAVA